MKILYFAPIPYSGLKQRPQFIAELLAEQHEVYYIDPTISILKFKNHDFKSMCYNPLPNLHVLRLSGALTLYRSIESLDFLHLNTISERIQLRNIISDCDLVWVGYPLWYYVIFKIKNKKLLYDKMDDNALITRSWLLRRLILQVEPKLIHRADRIFVTAQKFYEDIVKQNPNTHLVQNAVSDEVPLIKGTNNNSGRQIFGYVGTISHWLDFDAILTILNADEKNYVMLVGPIEIPQITHPRITYLGVVPHKKIPELIQEFDVCLYTFQKIPLLDTIDPVKIYEYLAQNKPVLAVKSRETEKFGDRLTLYDNIVELEEIAKKKFGEPFQTEEERMQFIYKNSWKARVKNILFYF